jgi:NADPH-dependent curcumin reductase CurA
LINLKKKQYQTVFCQGKLKVKETVTEGFDNMATAFLDLFKGGNTGKAIIKV